jgi:hypothetical protein
MRGRPRLGSAALGHGLRRRRGWRQRNRRRDFRRGRNRRGRRAGGVGDRRRARRPWDRNRSAGGEQRRRMAAVLQRHGVDDDAAQQRAKQSHRQGPGRALPDLPTKRRQQARRRRFAARLCRRRLRLVAGHCARRLFSHDQIEIGGRQSFTQFFSPKPGRQCPVSVEACA